MSQQPNYNERSWAIDLIVHINTWCASRTTHIQKAGGESSIKDGSNSLFPDVLLYGDRSSGVIVQGWELKMPDTPIHDAGLLENAEKKARALGLNSFVVWNVTEAVLYVLEDDTFRPRHAWTGLSHIRKREEVRPNLPAIYQQLEAMLADIAGFLYDGTLGSTPVDASISGDALLSRILVHTNAYASSLANLGNRDSAFEDRVSLWWISAKDEFEAGVSKWEVLAKANLVSLFKRIIFAHIIKRYNTAATVVDTISAQDSVEHSLNLIQDISTNADFWNILQRTEGDQALPMQVWRDLLGLNNVLKELHIEQLSENTLQSLMTKLTSKNTRKLSGQVATPYNLAYLLSRLTVVNYDQPVLDPCCGTGTIGRAVKQLKLSMGVKEPLETVYLSDKFSLPLQAATIGLVGPKEMNQIIRVFQSDATDIMPGKKIRLLSPTDGSEIIVELPSFAAIVSNLPFVRSEDLEKLNPNIPRINDELRRLGGGTKGLSAKSDLHAYLPFYLWHALQDEGRMGVIISNSWLGTDWGEDFAAMLGRFFDIEAVITSGKGRWFDNAKVVTNIVLLKKRPNPELPPLPYATKYITLHRAIHDVDEDIAGELKAIINLHDTYSSSDITVRRHSDKEAERLQRLSLPRTAYFTDLSWIEAVEDKVVSASSLFDINRGERRGWNALFYPPVSTDIEAEYLMPVLRSPRELVSFDAIATSKAFCCARSEDELRALGHGGALNWIASFERSTNEKGKPLTEVLGTRKGLPWYAMQADTTADFVASINYGDRLFIGKFGSPTFVDQRLIRFTKLHQDLDEDLVHALMNSVFGMFYLEAIGFGRGEGALDLSATKVRECLRILNPALVSKTDRNTIIQLFAKVKTRGVFSIEEEMSDKARADFDRAVLAAYGIASVYEPIKSSLLDLYIIRNAVKV